MAMIDSIRRRKWMAIVFVGLGLILFLGLLDNVDALSGKGKNPTIGKAAGKTILATEWQGRIQERQRLFNYAGNQEGLSNDVWNDFVMASILNDDYKNIGLQVSDEEFEGIMFGENLSAFAKSSFYQGQDSLPLKDSMRKNFEDMLDNDPEMYRGYKEMAVIRRVKEKYDALLKKGVYANSIDGKWSYKMKNDKVSVQYVVKKYDEIPDSTITYTDSELRNYYNQHKNDKDWEQQESRSIEFVKFTVQPSSKDSANLRSELETLKAEWYTAADDSAFVTSHSIANAYAKLSYKDGDYAGPENANIIGDSVGSIVGPYAENGFMRMVKIRSRGMQTVVDSATVRHILISNDNGKKPAAQVMAKADSIKKVIEKNKNFEEMVTKHTDDPGSKEKGGKYEWFKPGAMVPEFEKAGFEGKLNEMQLVTTTYGVHIVEPLERRSHQQLETKLSVIDREIKPSQETANQIYNEANNFSINFSDSASFRKAADTSAFAKLTPVPDLKRNAKDAGPLKDAYSVVNFAYKEDTEIGEVSQPFHIGNDYVIALLTDKKEKGIPTYANVEDKVKKGLIKEKKAEMLIEKIKNANNLDEAAKALETSVKTADNIMMTNNNIPGSTVTSQKEYEVIGLCFGIAQGKMSLPIKGDGGVYVIAPSGPITPGEAKDIYVEDQDAVLSNLKNRAPGGVYNAMKEEADVEDLRQQ